VLGKAGLAITFLTQGDSEVFYDLKMMLLKSPLSKIPRELSEHEAAHRKAQVVGLRSSNTSSLYFIMLFSQVAHLRFTGRP